MIKSIQINNIGHHLYRRYPHHHSVQFFIYRQN
jgi:hypothetical protein